MLAQRRRRWAYIGPALGQYKEKTVAAYLKARSYSLLNLHVRCTNVIRFTLLII